MIREINRQQIDLKTAQGERIVLIEALPGPGYETQHIPGAVPIAPSDVRRIATEFLPDFGAELVVYGEDERSTEVDEVAWQLSALGYRNLFVYRGGKKDWFEAGGFSESVHVAPPSGSHVRFAGDAASKHESELEKTADSFDAASGAE